MRRILSRDELARKEKRRNRTISLILLGIMVFGTAGFAFVYNSENDNSGKNVQGKVQNLGNSWVADYGDQTLVFSSSPESLNSTKAGFISDVNQYYSKPLYIDSESETIYYEIYSTLGRYAERSQHVCYGDCENSTWAEKNCTDNVIVFRPGDENKITQSQNCIFINGDIRAVDAFLYRIFGLN